MSSLACVKNVDKKPLPRPTFDNPSIHSKRLNSHPQDLSPAPVEKCHRYRKPSRKLAIRLLKSASFLRRSSTFRIEWITVEWCFPPKLRPISGSDACVSDLQRYIAICRGIAIDFELFRDFRSTSFRL